MAVHVYIFLLVGCLLFFLALLWRLDWLHLQPSHSRGGAKRSRLHRLLKPRCPDDCPACRLASTASSGEEPAPGPVRPWREVKSRRGAPKRVNTEGFACPNPQCAGRRTGSFRRRTRLRLPSGHHHEPFSLGQASTLSSSMSTPSATCTFRTSS